MDRWSDRHRDEQARYCDRFILPIIADVPCRQLTRVDFRAIIDQATTRSVAQHVQRCLTGLVAAGLEEGYLLVRQDVLRGVRWHGGDLPPMPVDRAVTEVEIPTTEAVHALARAAADLSEVWWRELQLLLVAYSGLRWGEHVALTADQIDTGRRRIRVDRQIVETRIPVEDLSRLLGHSSTRVTQDVYIHVRNDMYDRFYEATT